MNPILLFFYGCLLYILYRCLQFQPEPFENMMLMIPDARALASENNASITDAVQPIESDMITRQSERIDNNSRDDSDILGAFSELEDLIDGAIDDMRISIDDIKAIESDNYDPYSDNICNDVDEKDCSPYFENIETDNMMYTSSNPQGDIFSLNDCAQK